MNPAAVLALLGDLYEQIRQLQQQVGHLEAENEQLRSASSAPTSN